MKPLILLTGATGYIGGRLLKLFEAERHPVRCLVRRPEFLRGRVAPETDVVAGDLLGFGISPEGDERRAYGVLSCALHGSISRL